MQIEWRGQDLNLRDDVPPVRPHIVLPVVGPVLWAAQPPLRASCLPFGRPTKETALARCLMIWLRGIPARCDAWTKKAMHLDPTSPSAPYAFLKASRSIWSVAVSRSSSKIGAYATRRIF